MIVTHLPPPTNLFEWMDTISKLIEILFQAMGTLHPELGQLLRSLTLGWFSFICFGLTLILLLTGQFIASPSWFHRTINLFKYKKITTNQKMLFSIAIGAYFGIGVELILAFFKPISILEGGWCILASILLFWLLNPLLKRPESSQKLEDNIYDYCEQYKQLTDNQIHENI